MTDTQRQARVTARRLVTLARAGELGPVADSLGLLTYADSGRRERLREVLSALIKASAEMTLHRAGPLGSDTAFVIDLRGEDESIVDIDELGPPVRAVVRALLAEVNMHPEDTADQVALALAGDRCATVDAVVLALLWTVHALEWCENNDVPAPEWLSDTARVG
jgi:hypothetical protein